MTKFATQKTPTSQQAYACSRAWVAMRTAYGEVTACLSQELARIGLGVNDFEALLLLGNAAPERLRLGELNRAIALSQPALSRLVDRLERQGLARRSHDCADGRGVLIEITAAGQRALEQAIPLHAACVQGVFSDRLSVEEQETLVAILARISGDG